MRWAMEIIKETVSIERDSRRKKKKKRKKETRVNWKINKLREKGLVFYKFWYLLTLFSFFISNFHLNQILREKRKRMRRVLTTAKVTESLASRAVLFFIFFFIFFIFFIFHLLCPFSPDKHPRSFRAFFGLVSYPAVNTCSLDQQK